ncbi:MAG: M20/M25/M40 family metallo-hydrolase [Elusimicrobia bacterium]|nr:M20/M25/M40 family metallo-hydrolase [Elusimicrobiota bacterium]
MTRLLAALWLALPSAASAAPLSPLGRAAAETLKALVRIDTSNPPGNERPACESLAEVLAAAGVPYEIVESTPGRASLVARLKGDSSRRPLLLLAHLDTVGVEAERWSFPPLAGDEKDGAVRGRGAVDDKSMAAVFAVVLADLAKRGVRLKRDVVLAAVADEESGGRWGIKWLLEHRPELLDAELALNEGGTTFTRGGKVRIFAVQVQEKEYLDLTVTARGAGGHASVPDPDNAVLRLARALVRLDERRVEPRVSPVARAYFEALRGIETPELSAAFDDLLSDDEERVERGGELLRENPYYWAMVADTWAPTLLSGGFRENVLPSEARANLNVRLLPDTDSERFLEDLRAVAEDAGVGLEMVSGPEGAPPPAAPLDGAFWTALRGVVAGLSPGAVVVPSMSVGSTDAAVLRRRGVAVYGLEFPLSPDDQSRIHGHDERMPLAGLEYGVTLVSRLVTELAR